MHYQALKEIIEVLQKKHSSVCPMSDVHIRTDMFYTDICYTIVVHRCINVYIIHNVTCTCICHTLEYLPQLPSIFFHFLSNFSELFLELHLEIVDAFGEYKFH